LTSFSIIRKGVHTRGDLNRRDFLARAGVLSAIPWLLERAEGRTIRGFRFDVDLFSLGVASGDPTSSGAVIWTRCTINPRDWRSDFQVVEQVTTQGATAVTKASFVVENGKPSAIEDDHRRA
jgi:phosphodiesterase/alkaline phosphatase D-like protein